MKVILLGAGGTAAHNFAECIKMAGGTVVGADTDEHQLAACNSDVKYLSPTGDEEKLRLLGRMVNETGADFIHAQPDCEVMFLSRNRTMLPSKVCLPGHDALSFASDKMVTANILRAAGVPVPDFVDISEYRGGLVWMRARRGAGSRAALPVVSKDEALFWAGYWNRKCGMDQSDFMLSEFLPGTEYAWQSIWKNGELVASQGRVRSEYLFGKLVPSGQTSTPSVAKTVHNESLNDIAIRAIKSIDSAPSGVYGVDAKEDSGGNIKVTEINAGRFYSTSLFMAKAGCNMPHLYVSGACATESPRNSARAGETWVRAIDRAPALISPEMTRSIRR